ncbi:HIT family protein [Sulfodiicoccus acidiphilus]|uniref:HIT family protein n=1 Tax=Sulfodiicoccus acidiphilus TaxID=1670455 RepID=UPI001664928C|nr:HIT family protein [Sulfodiicoccus acidiphilus]
MCLFCDIVRGEAKSFVVYRDSDYTAFLDRYPISPGHTLVVPNRHFQDYVSTDEDVLMGIQPVIRRVARGVMKGLGADGVRIGTNVGRSAGQVIFHLHFHVIPTWSKGIPPRFNSFVPRKEMSDEEFEIVRSAIAEALM